MAYTTIDKPTDYFNTVLYSGTGSSNAITGVGFQPDLTWVKSRSVSSTHKWMDVVRGNGNTLASNNTNAEASDSSIFPSLDSDGFTVAGTANSTNASGQTYVGWNWLADNTSGSSNTDGSITSSVSANTTAGFSIVSYTGTGANATVGHGLGEVVKCIIIKNRDQTDNWAVGHTSIGFSNHLQLNVTDASTSAAAVFNSTAPTSTVFSIGTNHKTNASSEDYIAYCFAEKKGYSKFSSYTGNGNDDGPFVYTGFKPAWVMRKRTDSTGDWTLFDNKRPEFNVTDKKLEPSTSDAEASANTNRIDILSNGFKCRGTGSFSNASGSTNIYMAFAENPFVGNDSGTGIPATAK